MGHFEFILIPATTLLFVLSLLAGCWSGGVRSNIFYLFILVSQAYYLLLAPVVYYSVGQYYAVNQSVEQYFGIGFLQILLHLCFFLLGYWPLRNAKGAGRVGGGAPLDPAACEAVRWKLLGLFVVLYIVIFFNTLSEGFNLIDIIVGKVQENTMGLKGGSYFLQNFADSLITLIIAGYYFKVGRKSLALMIIAGIPLFLVLGFRYRLILTIFGLFLAYIHLKGMKMRRALSYLAVGCVFFYLIMFLTQNRSNFYTHQYDKIIYDPTDFPYTALVDQARGSMVDFALYQAVANEVVERDNGKTMFLYIFIKAIPASFFPGGEKPYPPPFLLAIDRSISAGREVGEAATALGGLFFGFGYLGIYIGGYVLGVVAALVQRRANCCGMYGGLEGIVIALVLFQWLTRGYFPQVVDHLVYMFFPVLFLKLATKRELKRLQVVLPERQGNPG